jgi:hypothetical protein
MRALHCCDKVIRVRILVRLPQGRDEECDGVECEWWEPDAENVCENLEYCAKEQKDSQVEVLAEIAVC